MQLRTEMSTIDFTSNSFFFFKEKLSKILKNYTQIRERINDKTNYVKYLTGAHKCVATVWKTRSIEDMS